MPTSFLSRAEIQQLFGKIEDFYPPPPEHIYHAGLKRGEITDDTEQSVAMANSFIRNGCVNPHDLVNELLAWAQRVENKYASPFGPSTGQALNSIKNGASLAEAGSWGDTNGAAMRIAPLGIVHGARGSGLEETLRDVALTCLPTHGTQAAIAAAAAVTWAIAMCFQGEQDPYRILKGAEQAATVACQFGNQTVTPSVQRRLAWIAEQVHHPGGPQLDVLDLYEFFGGGVAAADSVPVALGIFALCQGDPRRIILTAANMGSDSDTIGAIAGAVGGAYAGEPALPAAWVTAVQEINHLEITPLADALIEVAADWRPASPQQLSDLVRRSGGD